MWSKHFRQKKRKHLQYSNETTMSVEWCVWWGNFVDKWRNGGTILFLLTIIVVILEPLCTIEGEEVVYVNVGSSHSINCSVSSPDPPHHVFWYFNQEVIKDIGHRTWDIILKHATFFSLFPKTAAGQCQASSPRTTRGVDWQCIGLNRDGDKIWWCHMVIMMIMM